MEQETVNTLANLVQQIADNTKAAADEAVANGARLDAIVAKLGKISNRVQRGNGLTEDVIEALNAIVRKTTNAAGSQVRTNDLLEQVVLMADEGTAQMRLHRSPQEQGAWHGGTEAAGQ